MKDKFDLITDYISFIANDDENSGIEGNQRYFRQEISQYFDGLDVTALICVRSSEVWGGHETARVGKISNTSLDR